MVAVESKGVVAYGEDRNLATLSRIAPNASRGAMSHGKNRSALAKTSYNTLSSFSSAYSICDVRWTDLAYRRFRACSACPCPLAPRVPRGVGECLVKVPALAHSMKDAALVVADFTPDRARPVAKSAGAPARTPRHPRPFIGLPLRHRCALPLTTRIFTGSPPESRLPRVQRRYRTLEQYGCQHRMPS
jgi:hypothetical protein